MEMAGYCLFTVLAAFIGFLALLARARARQQQAMDQARAEYRAALAELQAAPGDEARRQRVIAAGRHYAKVAREQQAPMIFDEAALARDLETVMAGGIVVGPRREPQLPRRPPLDDPPPAGFSAEPEPRERAVGGE